MTKINRTAVFSDLHGDLDIMARSFAAMGIINYDGNVNRLSKTIKLYQQESDAPQLEKLIVSQKKPMRLLFLGDCLDRYKYGYHILQFFSKIDWEVFDIYPVFLMGNHDLLNFMLMTNPFHLYRLYRGNGPRYSKVMEYLNSMRLDESIKGFMELHKDELADLQKEFYREGKITFAQGHYSVTLTYEKDYSFFNRLPKVPVKREWEYINNLVDAMGLPNEEKEDEYSYSRRSIPIGSDILHLISLFHQKVRFTGPDWWNLMPRGLSSEEEGRLDLGNLQYANILTRKLDKNTTEILPIDWRIISMVWRKHYGDYFKNARFFFHENATIYVHGGISPLALTDPMFFGAFYYQFENQFFQPDKWMNFDMLLERSNRVMSQVLVNSLNDFSFEVTSGAEILDKMGYWRGCHKGFPQFGGPLWCDFEYLTQILDWRKAEETEPILELYRKFCQTYGIKRIICGHTPFYSYGKVGPRSKFLVPFKEKIGLEYICIDNGCSRAYRSDRPVINGIEIDKRGTITPPLGT